MTQRIGRNRYRVVFCGTPLYAVPALRAMAADSRFEVALVVTQPDRPAGRGRVVAPPPVKTTAIELGLPVYQPQSLRTGEDREPLASAVPDVIVVAAYGLIFGSKTLGLARRGCVNLHASLLPRYRGAAPVTAAILAGNAETGVTLMRMERGLDTGPVIAHRSIPIEPADTTVSLTAKLAGLGAGLVVNELVSYLEDRLRLEPQPERGACFVRPLVKADGWIDWTRSAGQIERQIRAMWDWPRATTTLRGESLQVHRVSVAGSTSSGDPGAIALDRGDAIVATGDGAIRLETVQLAGGKPVAATALVAGRKLNPGDRLGATGAPEPPPPFIRWLDEC